MERISIASLDAGAAVIGVKFSVPSEQETRNRSSVVIDSAKSSGSDGKPVNGGINDLRLGASKTIPCNTCGSWISKCVGHPGCCELNLPIPTPTFEVESQKWFKFTCGECNHIIFDVRVADKYSKIHDIIKHEPKSIRYTQIFKVLQKKYDAKKKSDNADKMIRCDFCENLYERSMLTGISHNKLDNISPPIPQYVEHAMCDSFLKIAKSSSDTPPITPVNIYERLHSIPMSDILSLGLDKDQHPSRLVRKVVTIPSVIVRHQSSGAYANSERTHLNNLIQSFIKINNKLENVDPNNLSEDDIKNYVKLINAYNVFIGINNPDKDSAKPAVGSTTGGGAVGVNNALKGKDGLLIELTLKKISESSFRAVIVNDDGMAIHTVGVSREIAESYKREIVVTKYNYDECRRYFNNRDVYPGAPYIGKSDEKNSYAGLLKNIPGLQDLQIGDRIYRQLVDGDYAMINRSPTAHEGSITYYRIIVMDDIEDYTVHMNVMSCASKNADFDGDQIIGQILRGEVEIVQGVLLTNEIFNTVSRSQGNLWNGLVQNGLLGILMLTLNDYLYSPSEVACLLEGINVDIPWNDNSYRNGREIISLTLPQFNYGPTLSPILKNKLLFSDPSFKESDKYVRIIEGKLVSGILCKDVIKGNSINSIYSAIRAKYGIPKMLKVLRTHQILANNFCEFNGGLSIASDIFRKTKKCRAMVDLITHSKLVEYNNFMKRLVYNNVEFPAGVDRDDYIEEISTRIMTNSDGYLSALLTDMVPKDNSLMLMVYGGVKGGPGNLIKMIASYGQIIIHGSRPKNQINDVRGSMFYRTHSINPESQGFIAAPLCDGLEPRNIEATGREVRQSAIQKNVSTSVPGTMSKDIVYSLGSMICGYLLTVSRGPDSRVVQLTACTTGFDPKNAFETPYKAYYLSKSEVKKIYGDRAKFILDEKDEYFRSFDPVQQSDMLETIKDTAITPIGIKFLCDALPIKGRTVKDKITLSNIKKLDSFIEDLPYLRFNEIYRAKRGHIPQAAHQQFAMLRIMLRSFISPDVAKNYTSDGFDMLLNRMQSFIQEAMWQPGDLIGNKMAMSFAYPLLQILLDAHHALGSKITSMKAVKIINEIMGLQNEVKTTLQYLEVRLKTQYEGSKSNAELLKNFIVSRSLPSVMEGQGCILYESSSNHVGFPKDKKPHDDSIKQLNIKFDDDELFNIKIRYRLSKNLLQEAMIDVLIITGKIVSIYGRDLIPIYFDDPEDEEYIIMIIYSRIMFDWEYIEANKYEKDSRVVKNSGVNLIEKVLAFVDQFTSKFIINEVKNIKSATVKSKELVELDDEGVPYKRTIYYVSTVGINRKDIIRLNVVDANKTRSNNIRSVFDNYGIYAAINQVYIELRRITDGFMDYLPENFSLLAESMVEKGFLCPISYAGHDNREPDDIIVRALKKNPKDHWKVASLNKATSMLTSNLSNTLMGQTPEGVGTTSASLFINMDEYYKLVDNKSSDNLEDLI